MNLNLFRRMALVFAIVLQGMTHAHANSVENSASIDDHLAIKQVRVNDVLVEVSVPKTCRAGAKIPCTVTIQNLGERPIVAVDSRIGPECVAALETPATASTCPFKAHGIDNFGPPGLRRRFVPGRRLTMQKGASKTWTIDLDTIFVTGLGKHQLTLTVILNSRDVQHYLSIPVDKVSFEIQQE